MYILSPRDEPATSRVAGVTSEPARVRDDAIPAPITNFEVRAGRSSRLAPV
jgi:hypothetical protein